MAGNGRLNEKEHSDPVGIEAPRLIDAMKTHWGMIALGLPAALFLSGLGYVKGHYGTLGFSGLVFSLPLETYVALGGISTAASLLFMVILIFLGLVAAFGALRLWELSRKQLKPGVVKRKDPSVRKQETAHPGMASFVSQAISLISAATVLAIVFILTWSWIVPIRTLPLLANAEQLLAGWASLAFLLVLPVVFGATYLISLQNLRGRAKIAFWLLLLLVASPAMTNQVGERNAREILHDPDAHTRARVWWTSNDTSPSGFVVVHQEGNLVYLVAQTAEVGERRIFHSTIVDVTNVHRIVFLPPGMDSMEAIGSP